VKNRQCERAGVHTCALIAGPADFPDDARGQAAGIVDALETLQLRCVVGCEAGSPSRSAGALSEWRLRAPLPMTQGPFKIPMRLRCAEKNIALPVNSGPFSETMVLGNGRNVAHRSSTMRSAFSNYGQLQER
jgi:hypothetical protein